MAELMETMRLNDRMTWVSLVKSTGRISTIGLSWTKSYSRGEPIRNAVTILPRLRSLAAPVTTPASTRSTTASVNISVWIPRSRLSVRASAVAAGMAPIPSWSVAPSGTSSATCSPIRSLDVADDRVGVRVRRDVDLDAEVDVVDVDEAVAERPRHRPVELDDDRRGGADGRVHRLDARPERAEAVGVGRRRVDEHDVERQRAALEQARDVGQEDRHVVGASLVDRGAGIRPDEQRAVPEVAGHLGRQVRPRSLGVQVDDADVVQLGRASTSASSRTDGVAAAQCR